MGLVDMIIMVHLPAEPVTELAKNVLKRRITDDKNKN
jgi:hypothetical protein